MGLGSGLVMEATELAFGLGCDWLICMPPAHTIDYFLRLGYVVDSEIPRMTYPDDRYISTVAWNYRPQATTLKLVDSQFNLDV